MRVLLDECLPRRLKQLISGHEVKTVPESGWAGKSNGELLGLARDRFDVFVTVDRNLPAQQKLGSDLAVVVLRAQSNRFQDLEPLVPELLQVLATITRGQLVAWVANMRVNPSVHPTTGLAAARPAPV